MTMDKEVQFGDRVVTVTPENDYSTNRLIDDNNLECRLKDGTPLWEIGPLLRKFSETKGLEYYFELFYGLQKVDSKIVRCIGNMNHCYVDVIAGEIVRIESNR